MDILKWECILEVELRVASYKRGEKAQRNFPVSICVTEKKDEAQQIAAAGCRGQEVNSLSTQYEVAGHSCYFLVEMTAVR